MDYLNNPGKGIVLDLSLVKAIDQVGFHSLNNILSGLRKRNAPLIIYSDFLETADQIRKKMPDIRVVGSEVEALNELGKSAGDDTFISSSLECPICANTDLPARVVDWDRIHYVFNENSFLPSAEKSGVDRDLDLYRHGVISCYDCLFTSFYNTDFIRGLGNERILPQFSLDIKNLLIKTTNRRRDMMLKAGYENTQFKSVIINKDDLETIYRLGADCITTISFDRSVNRLYEAGLSYLLIYYYMKDDKKDTALLEKSDTAFKDCIKYRPDENRQRIWQSYYFRVVLTMLNKKAASSLSIMENFRKERELLQGNEIRIFDLWYQQAQRVHKQEIRDVIVKYM